jgi:uncharacterized DUF497 family protein
VRVSGFDWDEENTAHIARHGVSLGEAEQVLEQDPLILRTEDQKYLAYGQTEAGRYLLVVFAWRPKRIIRVVTARPMTDGEKKNYRRRRN